MTKIRFNRTSKKELRKIADCNHYPVEGPPFKCINCKMPLDMWNGGYWPLKKSEIDPLIFDEIRKRCKYIF